MAHPLHPIYTMPKQGDYLMSFIHTLPWWLIVAGCVVGYGVGRVGLSKAWSDLKSVGTGLSVVYASLRNGFNAQKVQAAVTPTTTSTVVS